MNTEIINIQPGDGPVSEEDDAKLKAAGEILRRGGLVAFPTETVYGLGGDALNPTSSKRIYAAKGRPSDNPLIVHIYRFEDIYKITGVEPEEARRIADAFWPGAVTMVLPKSDAVPYETTGGLDTVAIRMPSHPAAQKLIEYSGGYIAAPSANTSGRPSPTMASHVEEDLDGKIDMILDGGPVGIGLESTIVDFTEEIPTILRPGYINQEMVRRVIGQVQMDRGLIQADSKVKPKAPGMKYRHYAPKADLTVVEGSTKAVQEKICALAEEKIRAGEKVGVIATEESIKAYPEGIVKCIGTRADEESIARHLFAVLREFDDCGVTYIYSEAFDTPQMGQAIMNRLMKAAGQKKIQV